MMASASMPSNAPRNISKPDFLRQALSLRKFMIWLPFSTLFQHLATDTARNLVVSAGAGAGKTAVLTRRMIKILREQRLPIDGLMVVTFTDKAAVEMKERVYSAIDREILRTGDEHFKKLRDDFLKNRISTFHAFCAALLREYPIEAQSDPYFRVMDETDKVFFLRRVIDRVINELAEHKEHPELSVLSQEWSKSGIANIIYALIQKREDTGPWLRDFLNLAWEDFKARLENYRQIVLREICYKLHLRGTIAKALDLLKMAQPNPPNDTSATLSLRRKELLKLLPRLSKLLSTAKEKNFDPTEVMPVMKAVAEQCNLSGANAKAWASVPENLDLLRVCFLTLRNTLEACNLEDYAINWEVEEAGYEICQALAKVATACLEAYREEKAHEHYLDFQDLQLKVLALLKSPKHQHVLSELRQKYLYIMVDEFQDTNALQWEIVKLIASDEKKKIFGDRLFIVGDEKQAIYSFRGGDVTLFRKVRDALIAANLVHGTHQAPFALAPTDENPKDYTPEYREKLPVDENVKSGEIIFSDNFRSAAEPIRFFNLFFEALMGQEFYEDHEARPQRLICSGNKRKGSVELLLVDRNVDKPDEALQVDVQAEELDTYTKEAHLIAAKIKEVLAGDDPLYDYVREQAAARQPAIAILLNRRAKLKIYEEALRRENIDFIVVRGRGFFQRQEVIDLGNVLGFLVDQDNNIYLAGFLRSPIGHVSDEGIYLLSRLPEGGTLWEKLCHLCANENSEHAEKFSPQDYRALRRAQASLERWGALSRRMVLVEFLRLVLDDGGFFASLARGNRGEQAISNLEKLLDRAREATLNDQEDFLSFTQWLNERIDHVEDEGEADVDVVLGGAVQLMTVHQSKGLEFPMVFVPDLNAHFNFGDREPVRFDDVTAEMKIKDDGTILRTLQYELGLEAPDPQNNFEPTPTLVKKIIEKRNREKTIAERKRLFYVACTRAMDHLVLVGQLKKRGARSSQTEEATAIDQMTSWMDWLSKILKLGDSVNGPSGTMALGNSDREHCEIRYRLFDENQSVLSFAEELRSDFEFVENM
jgi:ATP-dependent helicase/nuclease subunit A